jgi:general secretion pathway protein J
VNGRRRYRGLSLLELLVVLSLVSMVTTILFQGYGYMLANYQRIQARQAYESERALANAWLRGSLEALLAYTDQAQRFGGNEAFLSGATFTPLLGRAGIPADIAWELRSNDAGAELLYREIQTGRVFPVVSWDAGTEAAFSYLGSDGSWRGQWAKNGEEQLPIAIRLSVTHDDAPHTQRITAVLQTRRRQYITAEEQRFGRDG